MRQKITYTLIAVLLAYGLASGAASRMDVHPYITWIFGFTVVTWAFYGWDKRIAELGILKGWRVPEITLVLLALLGGCLGAWAGRAMFEHKTNLKKHGGIFALLVFSTLLHIALTVRIILGPPLLWWPPENWIQFTKDAAGAASIAR